MHGALSASSVSSKSPSVVFIVAVTCPLSAACVGGRSTSLLAPAGSSLYVQAGPSPEELLPVSWALSSPSSSPLHPARASGGEQEQHGEQALRHALDRMGRLA